MLLFAFAYVFVFEFMYVSVFVFVSEMVELGEIMRVAMEDIMSLHCKTDLQVFESVLVFVYLFAYGIVLAF